MFRSSGSCISLDFWEAELYFMISYTPGIHQTSRRHIYSDWEGVRGCLAVLDEVFLRLFGADGPKIVIMRHHAAL